jgi:hypothetical protein
MEPVQRREFLKNMGGIAATAAVIGTTMAPVAKAAGVVSSDHRKREECWDNDHSCQHQSCCYNPICDEEFDFSCFFDINCKEDSLGNFYFDVFCQGNGQSWRKKCDDGRKKKHHWQFRHCERKQQCQKGQNCKIDCKLVCHCRDDDGCGYKDHCVNFCVYCFVDNDGCCCYSVQCTGFTIA